MHHSLAIALAAFTLAACQPVLQAEAGPVPAVAAVPAVPAALSGPAKAGYELSEALCAGCHAIKPGELSPNPMSPTFEMIANSAGLTLDTLSDYLKDSHNYPETMNFEVAQEDSDVLAAYMITLHSDDYAPPIQ